MATVLHLRKNLVLEPVVPEPVGIRVRNYSGSQDLDVWLRVRQLAFAEENPGARPWSARDFENEILDASWWSAERFWLALDSQNEPQGTVICAARGRPPHEVPVVHWLAVVPSARRRGVGRLLMAHLESYCWRLGFQEVCLETHASWRAAAELYESLGYVSRDCP